MLLFFYLPDVPKINSECVSHNATASGINQTASRQGVSHHPGVDSFPITTQRFRVDWRVSAMNIPFGL